MTEKGYQRSICIETPSTATIIIPRPAKDKLTVEIAGSFGVCSRILHSDEWWFGCWPARGQGAGAEQASRRRSGIKAIPALVSML